MDDVSEPVKPQKQIERVTVEDQHKEKLTKLTDEANAALTVLASGRLTHGAISRSIRA